MFRSYIISLYLFLKAAEILVKYLTKDTWLERLPRKSEFIYAVSAAEAIFAVSPKSMIRNSPLVCLDQEFIVHSYSMVKLSVIFKIIII